MEINAALVAACSPETMYRWIHDIADYPVWLNLVHSATADSTGDEDAPAWSVELRARVGPLARSKRLRMVRTVCVDARHVRFERRELDGRSHSVWILDVRIDPATDAGVPAIGPTRLTMNLHYGGGLWSGAVLERILHDEIDDGRDRLKTLVETP